MGVTASVVAADFGEAADIVGSDKPAGDWKGFEVRGFGQARFAMLHALLSGQHFDEAQRDLGLLHAESEEGPWLLRFPAASVRRLAGMDEAALEAVGAELAATADFEEEAWVAEDVQEHVRQMAELAGFAAAQGKAIFLWIVGEE